MLKLADYIMTEEEDFRSHLLAKNVPEMDLTKLEEPLLTVLSEPRVNLFQRALDVVGQSWILAEEGLDPVGQLPDVLRPPPESHCH